MKRKLYTILLIVALSLSLAVPAFAHSWTVDNVPALPDGAYSTGFYYVENDILHYFGTNVFDDIQFVSDTSTINSISGKGWHELWYYQGNAWTQKYKNPTMSGKLISITYSQMIATSNDIPNSEGGTFFRCPLTLGETVALAVTEQAQTVVGTMAILAVCGVGCLALLMALPLLRTKLFLFLH